MFHFVKNYAFWSISNIYLYIFFMISIYFTFVQNYLGFLQLKVFDLFYYYIFN